VAYQQRVGPRDREAHRRDSFPSPKIATAMAILLTTNDLLIFSGLAVAGIAMFLMYRKPK
jgi:hypothetical protein